MPIPAGITIGWPDTAASIPAGWTRVTALDDKYVRGITNASTEPGLFAPITEDFEDASFNVTIGGTWVRNSAQFHGGAWSYSSPAVADGGTADATVLVPADAETLSVWYRVSSELNWDFLRILNDGVEILAVSGTVGWTEFVLAVVPGTTVTFRYTKDSNTAAGDDKVYIDDLVFTGAGAATHTHVTSSHTHNLNHAHTNGGTSGASTQTQTVDGDGTLRSAPAPGHTHTVPSVATVSLGSDSAAPSTDAVSNDPAHLTVIYIASNGSPTSIPAGALTFWKNGSLPAGWSLPASTQNKFLKGAPAAGNGGAAGAGSVSHGHSVAAHTHTAGSHSHSVSGTSGGTSATVNIENGISAGSVAGNHTHLVSASSVATNTLGSAVGGAATTDNAVEPPWTKLGIIQAPGGDAPSQIICLWTGTIASIPANWFLCDGNNGTPNLLGKFVKGVATLAELLTTGGGTGAHGHSLASHNGHFLPSHAHSSVWAAGTPSATNVWTDVPVQAATTTNGSNGHSSGVTFSGTPPVGSSSTNTADGTTTLPPYTRAVYIMQGPITITASAAITGTGGLTASAINITAHGAATMFGAGDLTAFGSHPEPCAALGYGGAWYGGTTVYGGFGICDAIPSLTPPTPQPNVLEISHSTGRLGCGVPSYFITSRCAGVVTCVLDGFVSDCKWDRQLDDVSKAEVTISMSGDTSFTCGECLEETEPWCHELHIWRDGEEVWVGPIQEIEYTYNEVIIRASDSLAWLGVRIPIVDIDHRTVAADLTTIATNLLTMSYALDHPNTCELDNLYAQATGTSLKLFYEKYNQPALEILRDLSDLGLNFTTLGRTIVLVGDSLSLTPLVLLNDEHILGDVVVTKNGTIQGNRYFVHFEEDGGVPVIGEATNFYCYSDIERIRDGDGLTDSVSAGQVAAAYASGSAIAPRTIEIPAGSQLSPDTPWTINQMVPGARVDVAISRLPITLTQSFLLTQVEATYSDRDGESIGISLTPLNTSAVVVITGGGPPP